MIPTENLITLQTIALQLLFETDGVFLWNNGEAWRNCTALVRVATPAERMRVNASKGQ